MKWNSYVICTFISRSHIHQPHSLFYHSDADDDDDTADAVVDDDKYHIISILVATPFHCKQV